MYPWSKLASTRGPRRLSPSHRRGWIRRTGRTGSFSRLPLSGLTDNSRSPRRQPTALATLPGRRRSTCPTWCSLGGSSPAARSTRGAASRTPMVARARRRWCSGTCAAVCFTPDLLSRYLRRAALELGMSPKSGYASRRSFATRAIEGGADVFLVQQVMGHADLDELAGWLVHETSTARARMLAALGERPGLSVVDDERGTDRGSDLGNQPVPRGFEGRRGERRLTSDSSPRSALSFPTAPIHESPGRRHSDISACSPTSARRSRNALKVAGRVPRGQFKDRRTHRGDQSRTPS